MATVKQQPDGTVIERITWLDAETRDAWTVHKQAVVETTTETMEATAVGIVIAETRDRVVLAALSNPVSYGSMIGIPKVSITSRKVLK